MLSKLEITNFRKFDRYTVEFGRRNLLVGPNNAGKSTLIEALRLISIIVNRFGALNFEAPPDWLRDGKGPRGVYPSLRGLDFDLGRETFHHYADPPAIVSATYASGERVDAYLGGDGDMFGVVQDADGAVITSKSHAKQLALPRIGIQPQVGPLARIERPLADRYVRGALDSSLAPNHFRNQLRLLDTYFDDFKTAAEDTWPGLAVNGLEAMGLGDERHIALLIRDGAFVGEVAAMGHGLQMWLQLMWFLARSASDGTVVLDEPDVYMHPDLQRRLLRFLLERDQQIIIATHSVEMMTEVEPSDLIPIDGDRRAARHARSVSDVQTVVDQVGGVHNLEFARLARSDRCLILNPSELPILRRWHKLVAGQGADSLDVLPTFPCAGWSDWPYAIAAKHAIDAMRQTPIHAMCLIASASMSSGFLEKQRGEARRHGIDLWVWSRHDLMSFLLDPEVIASQISAGLSDGGVSPVDVANAIDSILEGLRPQLRRQVEGRALDVDEDGRAALRVFDSEWRSIDGRLAAAPGRVVLLRLSAWARRCYGIKVGFAGAAEAFRSEDLPPEVAAVLRAISHPTASFPEPTRAAPIKWPLTASPSRPTVSSGDDVDDILQLFEEAGVIDNPF